MDRDRGGHHVRGRGVGFSPSDVLICHRLGLILLHLDLRAKRAGFFCAAGAIFLDQKVTKDSKSDKSVEQKTKNFDML